MSFGTLVEDLQDIVWGFCGDLRVPLLRYRKFVGLELQCWRLIMGRCPRPSDIARTYRMIDVNRLKETLELAYVKTQREAFLEKSASGGYTVRL